MRMKRLAGGGLAALALAASAGAGAFGPAGAAGAAGSQPVRHAAKVKGGTATYAEAPGTTPNYIFPMLTGAYYSVANIEQFERLSFRSLFWIGNKGKPVVDPGLSLAYTPTYSNNNSTVDIKLRSYRWSDGQPVTARDVSFWINLLQANKKTFAAYVPGEFPDNLKSYKITGAESLQLTLTGPVNPKWFTYDQLSQITPLPQQAWDKTSTSSPVGNYDETAAGAVKVFDYLTSQSKDTATYGTNPLWRVVDGPWTLVQYRSDGYAKFKANRAYSGPTKPTLDYFVEEPFTTDTAEFNVLRSGKTLDYGYLPTQDAAQKSILASEGYTTKVWTSWGTNFFVFNFNNPTIGPIVAQAYVRQAMQSLVDQPSFVRGPLKGYGHTNFGPVPSKPATYATKKEITGPWPFKPAKAVSLLEAHGWTVKPNGISACRRAGTGSSDCGKGIAAGTKLSFNLVYASGNVVTTQEMQGLKSDFARAGIDLSLSTAPFDTVIAKAAPCTPSEAACGWQMANWGGGWTYGVDPYPTGDQLFVTGSGSNFSNYSTSVADRLITGTTHGSTTLARYENYLAEQVPVIWMPQPAYQISEIRTTLHGAVPQSPIDGLTPENWYFTK